MPRSVHTFLFQMMILSQILPKPGIFAHQRKLSETEAVIPLDTTW
jgi:hypothetical protein